MCVNKNELIKSLTQIYGLDGLDCSPNEYMEEKKRMVKRQIQEQLRYTDSLAKQYRFAKM
jgi:hypothetical protein